MKIIVIEGLDGSGKSTQVDLIKKYLERKNLKVKTIHFPINDKEIQPNYSEKIYDILKGKEGPIDEINPFYTALFFSLNRISYYKKLVSYNALYDVLIIDRYTLSNIAYQGSFTKSDFEYKRLEEFIIKTEKSLNVLQPDLTFFIDIPVEIIKKRILKRDQEETRDYLKEGEEDKYEKDLNLLKKVRDNYLNFYYPEFNYNIVRGYIELNDKIHGLSPHALFRLIQLKIDETFNFN